MAGFVTERHARGQGLFGALQNNFHRIVQGRPLVMRRAEAVPGHAPAIVKAV